MKLAGSARGMMWRVNCSICLQNRDRFWPWLPGLAGLEAKLHTPTHFDIWVRDFVGATLLTLYFYA